MAVPSTDTQPTLPTVGRVVHYFDTAWSPEGPYAAIVSGVTIQSRSDDEIRADVDLTVFGNDPHHAVILRQDVPVVEPGETHTHSRWWQWPQRS